MAELPSGTVTFLFTDIEGSTTRWEHQPEAMGSALARHDSLLQAAIGDHGGHVFKTMGDAFCAAFARAPDALAAAIDAQRRLHAEPWGDIGSLRIRVALHTGVAEERDGDYFGPSLNRVARLLSAGHGGQVLLSRATFELVRDVSFEGADLIDLGEHRLKDLIRPERIFQLADPNLPDARSPLRTLDARPNNLPMQTTFLLGREREVTAAREQLLRDDTRLLTLTGPGGTGKTRLSLQVAAELIDQFAAGVFFVELAPISDPALVPSAIAQALEIRSVGARPVLDSLKDFLRGLQLLLVLDNFEQVLPAASVVSELLRAASALKVLATSRAPLDLRGEHELPVPPLALPDRRLPTPAGLSQYGAVALFIERATSVRPDFAVTNDNAPALAELCIRLDGLPLAIELAAAQVRLLSPQAMLTRLERRQPLLASRTRDLPARQQTLRGAIAWSYDLLDEGERGIFRRLAIFVGGCTLVAAEAVCDGDAARDVDMLDGMASLVAKSMLRQEQDPDGEPRFGMLETIRAFGLEQLEASGEGQAIRRRHAVYYLVLAEAAELEMTGPKQGDWLACLDREHANLRAALQWLRQAGDREWQGLRLSAALWRFWWLRSHFAEGRAHLRTFLALAGTAGPVALRAKALRVLGELAFRQGDRLEARGSLQSGLALCEQVGDRQGTALALTSLGRLALDDGRHDEARSLLEGGLRIERELGHRAALPWVLTYLSWLAIFERDHAQAASLLDEGLQLCHELKDREGIGRHLISLGHLALDRSEPGVARTRFAESLGIFAELGYKYGITYALEGLAEAHAAEGEHELGLRLAAAAATLREATGVAAAAEFRARHDRALTRARSALSTDVASTAWAEGRAMSLEQALAYALERTDSS